MVVQQFELQDRGFSNFHFHYHRHHNHVTMRNSSILRHIGKVRLADGLSPNEGRLEMYRHGTWYTMSYYYYFTQNDATVVCRQLGYLT